MRRFFVFVFCLALQIAIFSQTEKPRFVSLSPSITEIFFEIKAEESLVGVISPNNYPSRAKEKEVVASYNFINYEKIYELKVSECLTIEGMQSSEELKRLKDMKILVMEYKIENIEDLLNLILSIGEKTGREKEAQEIVLKMKKEIKKISENIDEKRGLLIVGLDPLVVAGKGSFLNDILKTCGIKNIFEEKSPSYFTPSFELIIGQKPQIIIFPKGEIDEKSIENFLEKLTPFVKPIKVIKIDADIIMRPSPRVVEGMKRIVEQIKED